MPEVKVTQTYNIEVARNVKYVGSNFIFRYGQTCFAGVFSKVEADGITIKMYEDGTAQATIKATAYLTVQDDAKGNDFASVKATFTITLNKIKISDLKGSFISGIDDVLNMDLDIDFNLGVTHDVQKVIIEYLPLIIKNTHYNVNIEQTVGKIEYTEK